MTFFTLLTGIVGLVMAMGLGLLYRKCRVLERQVTELLDFKGTLARQRQVERLQRDTRRTKRRRRS